MPQKTWPYLRNPFQRLAKRSHKYFHYFALYHFRKLRKHWQDQGFLQQIYSDSHPYLLAYEHAAILEREAKVQLRLATLAVEAKFGQLEAELLRNWDLHLQLVHRPKSMEYKRIMPNKQSFRKGGYEPRLRAVQTLGRALSLVPRLNNIQQQVEQFAQELHSLRGQQLGLKQQQSEARGLLDRRRQELLQVLHANFGALIYHYQGDAAQIRLYFKLSYLKK